MPKADKTEIICILDRSGSMDCIRDDAIGGFNAFLEEQQQVPGEANLTMMLFDDEFLKIHEGTPIKDVTKLDTTTYVPRGSTALLDAIGRTVNETEARLDAMDEAERPAKVLVLILTDGMENASREFDKGRIQKVIKDHEKLGWEFMYLKAGADAFEEAGSIGIGTRNYANVGSSRKGMIGAYRAVSNMAARYRAGGQSAVVGMSLQADANDNVQSLVPDSLKAARAVSMLSEDNSSGGADNAANDALQEFVTSTDNQFGGMLKNLADGDEEDDG